jgi:methyl-accepting chemotaxis protein
MKMNIRNKLLLSFGVILVLTGIVGYVGYSSTSNLSTMLDTLYVNQTQSIAAIKQANVDIYTIRATIRQAVLDLDTSSVTADIQKIPAEDAKVRANLADFEKRIASQKVRDGYDKLVKTYDAYMTVVNTKMIPLAQDPAKDAEAVAAINEAAPIAAQMDQNISDLVAIKEQQAADFYTQSNNTVTQSLYLIIGTSTFAVLAGLGVAFFLSRSMSTAAKLMATTADQIAQVDLPGLAAVASALAGGDLTRSTAVEARALTFKSGDEMGDLANSFNAMITRLHEVGSAFDQMTVNLRNLVGQVTDNANGLSSASQQLAAAAEQAGQVTSQISTTIQQVAAGIGQQTDSISRTAVSVEQMGRAIDGVAKGAQEQSGAVTKASDITYQITRAFQQVAANAQNGALGATQAAETAREGAKTVDETIKGMQSIKARVGLSAEKVQEMGRKSDQIGAIVETIDDIASQTNLLALNAAIEAARAGEHGKGFAVVADEVRKLAERSSTATKEIGGLIKGIQQTVAEAVAAMNEGAKEVEHGVERANQSDKALVSILKAVENVNQQVEEIAAAAQEINGASNELVSAVDAVSAVVEENTASTEQMSANSEEVTQAVENIASISEENSAAVEEVSASTEEMSAQVEEVNASAQSLADMAQTLLQVVAQFKLHNTASTGIKAKSSEHNGHNGHFSQKNTPISGEKTTYQHRQKDLA